MNPTIAVISLYKGYEKGIVFNKNFKKNTTKEMGKFKLEASGVIVLKVISVGITPVVVASVASPLLRSDIFC